MNIKFEEPKEVKNVEVEEEKVAFVFEDETICYETKHDQDCCEHVYGDFSVFIYYAKDLIGNSFEEIELVRVEGDGFLLRFNQRWYGSTKVFVPCYDFQNGYYSSELALQIKRGDTTTEIDISNLVSHHDG